MIAEDIQTQMQNRLHRAIGQCIDSALSNCTIIKDSACGGQQRIPLFNSDVKLRKTEYCNVDILILQDNKIRVIIEIEETNLKPTQICGKFLTSALSSFYIHKSNDAPISMAKSVLFIQVLDTSKLKQVTSKVEQWRNIEKLIQTVLPLRNSKVNKYRLFEVDGSSVKVNCDELFGCIRGALADSV